MPDCLSDDLKSRVSVPILPDSQKLNFHFSKSLEQKWLSNHGPCYQELKVKLADYLDAPNIELFSSGTLALLCGLRSLGLSGEVITTPFTFPATVNAIRWAGLKPVFADIVEDTLTISPDSVESLISEETCAILGVDVYGNNCRYEELSEIAKVNGLELAYDSAHSFSPNMFCNMDDPASSFHMISFHATKLFHTCEGGALVFKDEKLKSDLRRIQNFGFFGEDSFDMPGINAKMSEMHAAMGLAVLDEVAAEQSYRGELSSLYREFFGNEEKITVHPIPEMNASYTYLTLLFNSSDGNERRDRSYVDLKKNGYGARKYFNPLCSDAQCYADARHGRLKVARWVVDRVLCLPMHRFISPEDARNISQIVLSS